MNKMKNKYDWLLPTEEEIVEARRSAIHEATKRAIFEIEMSTDLMMLTAFGFFVFMIWLLALNS